MYKPTFHYLFDFKVILGPEIKLYFFTVLWMVKYYYENRLWHET